LIGSSGFGTLFALLKIKIKEPLVRLATSLAILLLLSACGLPGGMAVSDVAMGAGAAGLMYHNEINDSVEHPDEVTVDSTIPPQAKATTTRIANHIRDNVHATGRHLKDWWTYDPNAKVAVKTVPSSYCYRTQGDVLCYRAPMPGWEHRLVGYQGTFAEAPSPVLMQPLPGQSIDAAMLPANRVANAKPVFTEMPPEAREEAPKDPTQLLEANPENVQETIPDPTVSPQL
jgi:hypothetical protein